MSCEVQASLTAGRNVFGPPELRSSHSTPVPAGEGCFTYVVALDGTLLLA